MTGMKSDRPEENGEKGRKYPYIHPEDLKPSERLAIDADAIEDFIEHFEHHEEHVKSHPRHRDEPEADADQASEPA